MDSHPKWWEGPPHLKVERLRFGGPSLCSIILEVLGLGGPGPGLGGLGFLFLGRGVGEAMEVMCERGSPNLLAYKCLIGTRSQVKYIGLNNFINSSFSNI